MKTIVFIETNKAEQMVAKLISNISFNQTIRQATKLVKQEAIQNIENEGFTYGAPFARLAQSTRRDRARKGYGASGPILQRSGRLKRGFATKESDNEGYVRNLIGYAKYHQFGTKKMPRRRILTITDRAKSAIIQLFENHIKKTLR